jgi:histidyl-tRNA synthetase
LCPALPPSLISSTRTAGHISRPSRRTSGSSASPFTVNHMLVRGLDYYNRTTFEIQTDRLGAQNAVLGGGRYDGLSRQLGGPDHPAIGFALGMERLVTLLEEEARPETSSPDLFMIGLGERAEKKVLQWVYALRRQGVWVEMDYSSKG